MMTYRKIDIGRLVKKSPEKATKRLLEELGKNGGNLVWTAERIGVDVATLRRWVVKLDAADGKLRSSIAELKEKWPDRKRRSPKKWYEEARV